jgi:hypothetical protein
MTDRFTRPQTELLRSLDEEPGVWAECNESEWRTAVSLQKRGLVELDRDPSDHSPRRFDARTTSVSPNYNNGVRDIPYDKHVFVLARPIKGDWKEYDGSTSARGRQEFRPCMIQGHDGGQRLYVIGSQYAYDLTKFEIREFEAFSAKPVKDDLLHKLLVNGEADAEEQADAANWIGRLAGQA